MAATQPMNPADFTWGDAVIVAPDAPAKFKPGATGSVSGIRTIDNLTSAQKVGEAVGTRLYLLEFGDGTAVEVPPRYISPLGPRVVQESDPAG